jgi:hypothetical protein
MKQILLIAVLILSFMSFTYAAGGDEVVNALKNADATNLSSYLDNFIDLKLPEKDEAKNVGKTQASVTIKSFFEENKIKGFELASQREMGGTMYVAGKLVGGTKNYNITVMMKNKDNKPAIITIRIN